MYHAMFFTNQVLSIISNQWNLGSVTPLVANLCHNHLFQDCSPGVSWGLSPDIKFGGSFGGSFGGDAIEHYENFSLSDWLRFKMSRFQYLFTGQIILWPKHVFSTQWNIKE